jgi:MarR family transcriptional regulator, organic hydroperoxide resistance regulator
MKRQEGASEAIEVMRVMWALAHALEKRSKWMHREIGITGPQRLVLRVIGDSPGLSPGAAARQLSLNPGTVSRLVAALERSGLVDRNGHDGDGRRQVLTLTRKGKALNDQRSGTIESAVRAALAKSGPGQARAARKFIEGLNAALALPATRD